MTSFETLWKKTFRPFQSFGLFIMPKF